MKKPLPFLAIRDWACMALALVLLTGCGRPSAPPLQDGPVFISEREGFRFMVPEDWKQRARGEAPAGKIQSERMLAEYKSMTGDSPGTLQVTVADVPESTPLSEYITKNTKTGQEWRSRGPVQDFTINGVPAARIKYELGTGKSQMVREIIAFRRGERVYFFKGFYADADVKSRKAVQGAIDTVVW